MSNNKNDWKRWQESIISEALKTRRVLLLTGSRQCGKTTLVKKVATNEALYYTLDDVTLMSAAKSDPHGFIRHGNELMIIDEIQRATELIQAIKKDVDENQSYGRFLLTGSTNIQTLPNVKESLAGRISNIRLRPLTLGELYGTQPNFIINAFKSNFKTCVGSTNRLYDKDEYLKMALKGGYPEVLKFKSDRDVKRWYTDFIEALLENDLREISNIKRKNSLYKLVEVLAAWSSKFIDISAIGSNLSISRPTIESYINALESLFLIDRVRPWHKTDYDRVSKQDKLFMADTGLMASVLGWRFETVRLDGELNGKLIETFVYNQLIAILDAQVEPFNMYHYRDREKREIDFIIEDEAGDLLAIEVKAGSVITKDNFKHIRWFKDNMVKNVNFKGVVFYTGEHIVSFGNDMWALPINYLWASID